MGAFIHPVKLHRTVSLPLLNGKEPHVNGTLCPPLSSGIEPYVKGRFVINSFVVYQYIFLNSENSLNSIPHFLFNRIHSPICQYVNIMLKSKSNISIFFKVCDLLYRMLFSTRLVQSNDLCFLH